MKNVQTVLGPISPRELGVTLVHEHLFVDGRRGFIPSEEPHLKALADEKVNINIVGLLRRAAHCCRDNLFLDDEEVAVKEVGYFKDAGGSTIVDLTAAGIGRNPLALKRVSEKTGVNIISGCGFYVDDTHPEWVKKASIEELKNAITHDLTVGMDGTGIKAGVIGEIGVSPAKMTNNEEKVLKAAARAQIESNVAMTVHVFETSIPSEKRQTLHAVDILEGEGVDLSRVYMSHIDQTTDWEYVAKIGEKGVHLAFDTTGSCEWPYGFDSLGWVMPTDYEKAQAIRKLIERGFLKQILLSTAVFMKSHLRSYGGVGYGHIPLSMPKVLRFVGISDQEIHTIMVENPKRILTG